MSKSGYKDYTKASDYFNDPNDNVLREDIESLEKTKKHFVWVQEFSKKVVVIVFFVYIAVSIMTLLMVYQSYLNGDLTALSTLISEINSTFRDVIVGYCVKAGIENTSKIAGNYYIGIMDAKLKAEYQSLKDKKVKGLDNDTVNNFDNVEFEEEEY